MSRIGKKPIPLPSGVKIKMDSGAGALQIEGPKGKLTVPVPTGIVIEQNGAVLDVKRENDSFRAVHGLTRALTANAVQGVSAGFTRELDIVGVGFRAEMKGKETVHFTLGYSHNIEFVLPSGVEAKVDKNTHVVLTGYDKQVLGQVAANMRALRKPDPYKNKGVRYTGEVLRKKAGKSGAGGKGK
ncbi:MAG TPA: 50S ribosomal protein L6 [Bryobacteraceae bacterium]|nr:50S ribosomal protein L6 [Bryobacteraceae bacterium]